jgi:hypothetical protein
MSLAGRLAARAERYGQKVGAEAATRNTRQAALDEYSRRSGFPNLEETKEFERRFGLGWSATQASTRRYQNANRELREARRARPGQRTAEQLRILQSRGELPNPGYLQAG